MSPELHKNKARLDAFRAGKHAVLEELYHRHNTMLLNFLVKGFYVSRSGQVVRLWTDDPLDRLELVQETFTRAFSQNVRLSYTGERPFGAFLVCICRNLVVDRARKRHRWNLLVVEDKPVGTEEGSPTLTQLAVAPSTGLTAGASPEAKAQQGQIIALVRDLLATLDEQERELLCLFYQGETSQRLAAASMGISRDQVRTLVQKIRKRVLRYMYEHGVIDNLDPKTLMTALAVSLLGGAP